MMNHYACFLRGVQPSHGISMLRNAHELHSPQHTRSLNHTRRVIAAHTMASSSVALPSSVSLSTLIPDSPFISPLPPSIVGQVPPRTESPPPPPMAAAADSWGWNADEDSFDQQLNMHDDTGAAFGASANTLTVSSPLAPTVVVARDSDETEPDTATTALAEDDTESVSNSHASRPVPMSHSTRVAALEDEVRFWRRKAEAHAEQLRHSGENEDQMAALTHQVATLTTQLTEQATQLDDLTQQFNDQVARNAAATDAISQWVAQSQQQATHIEELMGQVTGQQEMMATQEVQMNETIGELNAAHQLELQAVQEQHRLALEGSPLGHFLNLLIS